MNSNIEQKITQIENKLQKVDEMCETVVNLSAKVKSIEGEMHVMNRTKSEFEANLKGLSNVFDEVKECITENEKNTSVR
jgi:prefoldin subunit 5